MPVVSIQLYGLSVGSMSDLGLFEAKTSLTTQGRVTGAVFATSALAGIFGLFQSLSVRTVDRRLVISGFRRFELVVARFTTVVATALVVAAVTTISLEWVGGGRVELPGVTFVGLLLAGAVYGLIGVLVGSVLPRELEGSLVLVALADIGAIVSSGLFGISDSLVQLLPLSHPQEIVLQAVSEGSVASAHLLPALCHLLAVTVIAAVVCVYALPPDGDAH
ncbi:hypothetical protein [Halomontanus rarus]|uniref:hypothetical protein n=1 Tax=Halomontanus rarus TaxID=3034020 RepID=UPI0023E7E65E|nr:hypothetical protein [Halovivax sp. TS33]